MMARVEDVVIVGAGIAGLATAVALKRAGVEALVLEKSDGLRATGAALTLFPNAWCALDALGVSHHLTSLYAPIKKGYVTDIDTGEIQQVSFAASNGNDPVGPMSVNRKALLKALADKLPPNSVRFASKLTAIETQEHEGSYISYSRGRWDNNQSEDSDRLRWDSLSGCPLVRTCRTSVFRSMGSLWLGCVS